MSEQRRTRSFLMDIEDAIGRILEYTAEMDWEQYSRDKKTQDAVIRNLEVIGEATKNISDEFRSMHTGVPWRDMAGTRDRLMHNYFGVNQEIVWQIVQQDLPPLKKQMEQLVRDFPLT